MKILLYNIGYSTGLKGSLKDYFLKFWRYLRAPKENIHKIAKLLKTERADVVCLLETDAGSFRSRSISQAQAVVRKLRYAFWKTSSKYHPDSWYYKLPFLNKHHDAILSRQSGKVIPHYLKNGMDTLVQEFIINNISIFTVHLGLLRKKLRKVQMKEVAQLLKKCPRAHLICGDFNIFNGLEEIREFLKEAHLKLVQKNPTFPAFSPRRPLDLIMTCESIKVKTAGVVNSLFSDHLPVFVEIDN
ncbi:endonuclease/exonuclease/phosphatase family protein [Candidatus Peregrinibacteria bacterium]|nr:endonuclease/exonuclease/phosphatase family protein [Candidatus Peregrinibacteria bacterium]